MMYIQIPNLANYYYVIILTFKIIFTFVFYVSIYLGVHIFFITMPKYTNLYNCQKLSTCFNVFMLCTVEKHIV